MTKYTTKKVFEKTFSSNIWKIEVDSVSSLIAVETRDLDTNLAAFHVFDFSGNCMMSSYLATEREWTLDSIQNGHLILKKIGENTPIQEGIQIICIQKKEAILTSYDYVLIDVYQDFIHARHRSIVSGSTVEIEILTGIIQPAKDRKFHFALNKIQFPIATQFIPEFLKTAPIIEPLWLSKCGEQYLWCYHQKTDEKFNIIFTLSDLNQILDCKVILEGMDKMIPQPYFQIEKQLFLMSFNKRKIISYLV